MGYYCLRHDYVDDNNNAITYRSKSKMLMCNMTVSQEHSANEETVFVMPKFIAD